MAYPYPRNRVVYEVTDANGLTLAGPFFTQASAVERAEVLADSRGGAMLVYRLKSPTHSPHHVKTVQPRRGRR